MVLGEPDSSQSVVYYGAVSIFFGDLGARGGPGSEVTPLEEIASKNKSFSGSFELTNPWQLKKKPFCAVCEKRLTYGLLSPAYKNTLAAQFNRFVTQRRTSSCKYCSRSRCDKRLSAGYLHINDRLFHFLFLPMILKKIGTFHFKSNIATALYTLFYFLLKNIKKYYSNSTPM